MTNVPTQNTINDIIHATTVWNKSVPQKYFLEFISLPMVPTAAIQGIANRFHVINESAAGILIVAAIAVAKAVAVPLSAMASPPVFV